MNVLHVLNGAVGGASLSTLALIEGMAAHGVNSFIYCSSRASKASQEELKRRSPVPVYFGPLYFWNKRNRKALLLRPLIEVFQQAYTGFLYRSSSRLMKLCRELDIDLIHSSTSLAPDGAIAAQRLGLPHVWHIREMIGPGQLHRLAGDGNGEAARRFQRTGQVAVVSEAAFKSLFATDQAQGACVLHNGFDFSKFETEFAPPLRQAPVRFGLIANLSATWKRHELFIRAAQIVAARLPEAEFSIYGEIPSEGSNTAAKAYYQGILKAVEDCGLSGRIQFKGYQSNIVEVMRAIDIVVHAAEHESFGRVYVEASAAMRGLVAVRGGAASEIVDDGRTGLLVPPNDPQAMAEAMLELAGSPERVRSMATAARARALELYDIRRTCERLMSIYRDAAAAAASREPVGYLSSFARVMA